jgi:hypothetical protein
MSSRNGSRGPIEVEKSAPAGSGSMGFLWKNSCDELFSGCRQKSG